MATAQELLGKLRGESVTADDLLLKLRGGQQEIIPPDFAVRAALNIGGDNLPIDQPLENVEGKEREFTNQEMLKGSLDALKTLLFGGAFGSFGGLGGTVEGFIRNIDEFSLDPAKQMKAAQKIQELSEQRASEFARPFAPDTEAGAEITKNITDVLSQLPVVPQLAYEIPMLQQLAKSGFAVLPAKLDDINQKMSEAAEAIRAKSLARQQEIANLPVGSVGAQAVDIPTQRIRAAEELPVPIQLTEGQATRGFEQQRFERETAKMSDIGEPLRERFAQQNAQLIQNFDSFIDETGAELYYPVEIGETVEKAIRADAAKDMKRIRRLYNEARSAGEMGQKVDIYPLSSYLNANRAERAENSIMTKVQRQLEVLEVAEGSFEDGSLSIKPITLNQSEAVRRFINRNVNDADPNDVRIAANLKNLIDASTEGEGGIKYRAARKARRDYAEKFENVGLINNILSTKRGTQDRIIALEDVVRKSILSPSTSRESTYHLRKVLQNAGDEGNQAWRELQGATLRHLQDQMTKNVARNEKGDPIVSAAALDREIKALSRNGKLELLFGKKGSEQIETINDVAKVVLTSPPGAVNTSNTATVLAGLMDIAVSGSAGIPSPVFTAGKLLMDGLKDKKLKARVNRALRYNQEEVK